MSLSLLLYVLFPFCFLLICLSKGPFLSSSSSSSFFFFFFFFFLVLCAFLVCLLLEVDYDLMSVSVVLYLHYLCQ